MVNRLGDRPVVVKVGGRALEAPGAAAELAEAVSAVRAPVVIVHGGGADVTAWSARLGLQARFHEGRRVTDAATLDVVVAVLRGLANTRLVAALRAGGVDAVGLSALDGDILTATASADAALGFVGLPHRADASLLWTLLDAGRVPVLATVAGDGDGGVLNVNADDAAAAVAVALRASDLVLLSDAPGVLLQGALAREIPADRIPHVLASPDVSGGMLPKLTAAASALAAGVGRVTIAAWQGPTTLRALRNGSAECTVLLADDSPALAPA